MIVQEVIESLQRTVDAIDFVNDLIKGNAENADNQAVSMEQIRTGIEDISEGIQDSSAMSEESAATSDELAEQAQRLNSMVGRFQLN